VVKRENARQLLIRKLETRLGEAVPLSEDARRSAAALLCPTGGRFKFNQVVKTQG
jgi:hypothetical protein